MIASIISSNVGIPEESANLFISLLLSYPICIVYNTEFLSRSKSTKLFYHLLFGLFLVYFNFGLKTVHSLFVCLFCYIALNIFDIQIALILNFTVPLIYLIYGCYVTQIGSKYTITWTLPQCVLTLKLIAISFDIYDGIEKKRSDKKLPSSALVLANSDTAIDSVPSLLEFMSHCYFPATIFVGPLIPYRKFIDYINSDVNRLFECWKLSVNRLVVGVFYALVFAIGSLYWPTDYLLSKQFSESSFFGKTNAILIISKFCSSKYLMAWLISEGACIASGIAFDGKTKDHSFCTNIFVRQFETSWTVGRMIKSFNLTTNCFVAKYVYKRLKFLGNKTLSKAMTLLFLSLWHGIDTGYLIAFGMEFLIMKMEIEVTERVVRIRQKYRTIDRSLNNLFVKYLFRILLRIYTIYLLAYSFVPFMLIKPGLWLPVLKQIYFFGHLITISWAVISLFI